MNNRGSEVEDAAEARRRRLALRPRDRPPRRPRSSPTSRTGASRARRGQPVFRREDVLGSGRTESLEGVTEYATTEVASGGDVLRGTFERDGTRHGTFRMLRAGATGPSRAAENPKASASTRCSSAKNSEPRSCGAGARCGRPSSGARRRAARFQTRCASRSGRRSAPASSSGSATPEANPRNYELEVESLTREIERQVLDEGRSLEEVEQLLKDGKINP